MYSFKSKNVCNRNIYVVKLLFMALLRLYIHTWQNEKFRNACPIVLPVQLVRSVQCDSAALLAEYWATFHVLNITNSVYWKQQGTNQFRIVILQHLLASFTYRSSSLNLGFIFRNINILGFFWFQFYTCWWFVVSCKKRADITLPKLTWQIPQVEFQKVLKWVLIG